MTSFPLSYPTSVGQGYQHSQLMSNCVATVLEEVVGIKANSNQFVHASTMVRTKILYVMSLVIGPSFTQIVQGPAQSSWIFSKGFLSWSAGTSGRMP